MYVDTSSLFPYYIPEEQSMAVQNIFEETETIQVSSLTDIEFISAINKRQRMGQISKENAEKAYSLYREHRNENLFEFQGITDSVFTSAELILRKTSAPLRSLDALHLAVAEENNLDFFTFDHVLQKAAREFKIKLVFP